MQRCLYQLLSVLLLLTLPSVAWAAGPIGGYYIEDRALTPALFDPTGINQFAISVAISDGIALVGASRELGSGNAHLYDSKTGALLHTLSPGNKSVSGFGRTVALEGKYAVVGSDQGSYVYDVNNYELLHVLPGSRAIDIDHGRVLIGGYGVYNLSSGERLTTLPLGGTSVALSGEFAIVGEIGSDSRLVPGSARVFDWKNERQLYDLTPSGMPNGSAFGVSVAADGNIVVVGAGGEPNGGSAYVFDLATGNALYRLEETGRIYQPSPSFGYAVTIHGDIAIVGAYRQTDYFPIGPAGQMELVIDYGAAYAFSVQNGEEIARFTTSGPRTGGWANYAFSLDYDGSQLIAGTLGWPKKAYITDFAIPEPTALVFLTTCVMIGLSQRKVMRESLVSRSANHSRWNSEEKHE
jgi:hypothetical protein